MIVRRSASSRPLLLACLFLALMPVACRDGVAPGPGPNDGELLAEVPEHFILAGQRGDHAVLLEPGGRLVNLLVRPAEYEALRTQTFGRDVASRLAWFVYGRIHDRFDFMILTFDPGAPREALPVGLHIKVSNVVGGLNVPLWNDGRTFAGTDRLQGVTMLQRPANVVRGPLLHEIAHQWGQTLVFPTVDWLHWGLAGVGGQLGGWSPGTVEELEDGLFRAYGPTGLPFTPIANYGNRPPFAPWELYMMGLLPADSLHSLELAAGGEVVDLIGGLFRADSIVVREPAEILPRTLRDPAWPDAPTAFNAMFVVLGTEPLDPVELGAILEQIEAFTTPGPDGDDEFMNFWEATGGRGTFSIGGVVDALR